MSRLRVLVVEDNAVIGGLLGEMLESLGHDVCAIEATEPSAVAAAARCRPQLMIVDMNLGDGSGVAAVAEIVRAGPVPHVFITGEKPQACKPGAIVLRKPFLECDLVWAIQRAMAPAAA
jgi:two-component system, response regulator PdtaR